MKRKSKSPTSPAALSLAIERHLGLWWTDEIRRAIRAEVGAAGLKQVEEITSFASAQDEWQQTDLASAIDRVEARLRDKFPFLSPVASGRIVNQAAYGWK